MRASRRIISIILSLLLVLCLFACTSRTPVHGTDNGGTQGIGTPDPGDNTGGSGDNTGGSGNEGDDKFEINLPETPARIDITTADGTDITGDERNQEYKLCAVTVTGGRDGEDFANKSAQVRVRGNNTAGFPKKSFRVKFDKKQSLLGLNGGAECKNWVLLACYKDVSFLRDAAVFEFGKATLGQNGYYCSDYTYAEVYINDSYNGFYFVAEQQQVNKNRIDINEPVEGYAGVDIGYLIEYDGNANNPYRPEEHYFRMEFNDKLTTEDGGAAYPTQYGYTDSSRHAFHTIKNDIYSNAQKTFITDYMNNVYKIMYSALYKNEFYKFNAEYTGIERDYECASSREAIEKVLHIDSAVDMFLLQELGCDNDIDWSSFFMTADMSATGSKKLAYTAPWDFDSGLGMMRGLESLDKIFSANKCTNAMFGLNPWLAVLWKADWFRQELKTRWAALTATDLFKKIDGVIDFVTQKYAPQITKNYQKWDNLGVYTDERVQSPTVLEFATHADASNYLKAWINHRVEFLTDYFAAL